MRAVYNNAFTEVIYDRYKRLLLSFESDAFL